MWAKIDPDWSQIGHELVPTWAHLGPTLFPIMAPLTCMQKCMLPNGFPYIALLQKV
jgi:hypothetical protein